MNFSVYIRKQNVALSRIRVNTLIRLWLLLSVEDAALDASSAGVRALFDLDSL
jgi:hypothetical protein